MRIITWDDFPSPMQSKLNVEQVADLSTVGVLAEFMQFIKDIKEEGFSVAVFGKPFSEVLADSLTSVAVAIGKFITGNGDFFFLLPALIFTITTFMVGRHKYTKWIIPLLFAYTLSRAFFKMLS